MKYTQWTAERAAASIANGYARTLRRYADTIIAARSGRTHESEKYLEHLAVNGFALAATIVITHPRYSPRS